MSRLNRSIIASLLLALLLPLLAAPVGAQWLVIYIEPVVAGAQDENGVYIGDVEVTWTLQEDWVIEGGCEDTYIDEDTEPEGMDLLCYGTVPPKPMDPGGEFGGGVNIVRQAAPPEQSFIALKAGVEQMESDEIINLGQAASLHAKADAAETEYYLGELKATSNILHAFQNELVALSATIETDWSITPGWQTNPNWHVEPLWAVAREWLLAESLIRVVTPSMAD